MEDSLRKAALRLSMKEAFESVESSHAALTDAGLQFGDDYATVTEGIRLLTHHRDSLVHELRRIKGIADGALPK
jgi:hypothetical protein